MEICNRCNRTNCNYLCSSRPQIMEICNRCNRKNCNYLCSSRPQNIYNKYKDYNQPICSYGVILYKYEGNEKKYLMIRRKHTLGYIVLIRGKYTLNDHQKIQIEVDRLTVDEKEKILNNSFDDNWDYLWTGHYSQKYNKEKTYANSRYNLHIDKIKECILSSSTQWLEPEWEFPKGRLHIDEPMIAGAVREFTEETNISSSDITIIKNLFPFEETYISSNDKLYKNTYYLAKFTSKRECDLTKFQIEEVSQMKWLTEPECIQHIRPYNTEKKILIRNINKVIHNYLVV